MGAEVMTTEEQALNLKEELDKLEEILREAQTVGNCSMPSMEASVMDEGAPLSRILDYRIDHVKELQDLATGLVREMGELSRRLH